MSHPSPSPGPAKGEEQFNKINGRAAEALFRGERPGVLVALDVPGGTPNQKGEKIANRLWNARLFAPVELAAAMAAAVAFLKGMLTTGHMCVGGADEALTASHAPIWERLLLSLYLSAWALRDKPGGSELWSLAKQCIGWHLGLYKLLMVPESCAATIKDPKGQPQPIAGMVIGPGARNAKLFASYPQDEVRSVVAQLGILGHVVSPVGGQFWAKVDQSTLAGPLAKTVLQAGGPGFPGTDELPKLHRRLRILRAEDGHAGIFDGPGGGDFVPVGWVRYSTGETGFGDDPGIVPADLLKGKETVIPAA